MAKERARARAAFVMTSAFTGTLAAAIVSASAFAACVGDGTPVNGDPDGATSDSGSGDAPVSPSDDGAGPSGDASARCTPEMAFGQAELVPGVSSPDDDDQMTLTPDELKIYFTSNRSGGPVGNTAINIWVAERPTRADGFSGVKPLLMNTGSIEGDPMLSPDGQFLYFTSNASGAGGYDLFRIPISRTNETGTAAREPLTTLNTTSDEMAAFVTGDGTIYFVRTGPAPDKKRDIFRAKQVGNDFGSPDPVTELVTSGHDQTPVLSTDGLVIYWSSDRTDLGVARGGHDIFIATKTSSDQAFTNPRRVDELSTSEDENPGWLSPDGCSLYFTRNAGANKGEIYVAHRSR